MSLQSLAGSPVLPSVRGRLQEAGGRQRPQGEEGQHGVEDLESDSHRLSGPGSSNRAPGVRFSNFNLQSLIASTPGIALRLLPVRDGPLVCASGGPRVESRLSHGCVQLFVSNVLGSLLPFLVSEIVTWT